MIIRRTNTWVPQVHFLPSGIVVGNWLVPRSREPYFRTLWLRRGQWVSLAVLMDNAGTREEPGAVDTLMRLTAELHLRLGWTIDRKYEPVFDEPNADRESYHSYYRLTTPEVLPAPTMTGREVLSDTDWEEVPLEEADDAGI